MMRNRHDLRIEKFRDVSHRKFTVPQRINNPQAMRIAESLQSLRTKRGIEYILFHNLVTVLQGHYEIRLTVRV